MIIKAKFASKCPVCSKPLAVGDDVEWQKGEKAKHPTCWNVDVPARTANDAPPMPYDAQREETPAFDDDIPF